MKKFKCIVLGLSLICISGLPAAAQVQRHEHLSGSRPLSSTHAGNLLKDTSVPDVQTRRAVFVRPETRIDRGPFASIQVNVDEAGMNIVGDAANEPSLAVDPTDPSRIVVGWRQFNTRASDFRVAGWAYSHDGGQSWTFPGVLQDDVFRSDPVLAADAEGTIYYYSLTVAADELEGSLFTSTDQGVSWQGPVSAYGGDKPWMTVDRTGGEGSGNIYVIWQRLSSENGRRVFTRSVDGGSTFCEPVNVSHLPSFGKIAVGPDGEVYAAGIRWPLFSVFAVARSTDARDSAADPTFTATLVNMGGRLRGLYDYVDNPNPVGLLGQVEVAADHSHRATRGHVYVLASVDPPGADPLDVHFVRSTDGGRTWSRPLRINDDAPDQHAWQWFGTLAVAPNGRIDAAWNDTRATGRVNLAELYYACSHDGGLTWSANMPVSPVFDSHLGWPDQEKIGDYYGMISDNATASIAYAATFNGEQDIYFLKLGDCNANGRHDSLDISRGTSLDENADLIPDECDQ